MAFQRQLNAYGRHRKACFFVVDFEGKKPFVADAKPPNERGIRFDFPARRDPDAIPGAELPVPPHLTFAPPDEQEYARAFGIVRKGLLRGDSYLVNLTMPVPLLSPPELEQIYRISRAKYRVYVPGKFVSFSPETFVTIRPDGAIETRPMKGTAPDTAVGRRQLLTSTKEQAEHATIVDLLRNDLSRIARRVRVGEYRYLRAIDRGDGALVQTSSRIEGQLGERWTERLGDILAALLPAGSVSGAPKQATLDLIRRAEGIDRGYYCGVAGYFDGRTLDSCVLIRFIEAKGNRFRFRSGGGVTALSEPEQEYRELLAKVRIPTGQPILRSLHSSV